MEFPSDVPGGEAPLDDITDFIAFLPQGLDFPSEGFLIVQPLLETVAGGHAELALRHIQPTALLGRVVNSSFVAVRRGSAARNASSSDALQWVFRLSNTTRITGASGQASFSSQRI